MGSLDTPDPEHHMSKATLSFLVLPILAACETEEIMCPSIAAASVMVEVIDQNGDPIVPTALTYTIDDGEEIDATCEGCSEFVLEFGIIGTFDIRATLNEPMEDDPLCWYMDSDNATAVVEDGECFVSTEHVTLVLDTSIIACE
jgi:hypothetical protein